MSWNYTKIDWMSPIKNAKFKYRLSCPAQCACKHTRIRRMKTHTHVVNARPSVNRVIRIARQRKLYWIARLLLCDYSALLRHREERERERDESIWKCFVGIVWAELCVARRRQTRWRCWWWWWWWWRRRLYVDNDVDDVGMRPGAKDFRINIPIEAIAAAVPKTFWAERQRCANTHGIRMPQTHSLGYVHMNTQPHKLQLTHAHAQRSEKMRADSDETACCACWW